MKRLCYRGNCLLVMLVAPIRVASAVLIPQPEIQEIHQASVFLAPEINRPLRYTPVGTDFVITNGTEFFNRPLYGGSDPLRIDAGDVPEFSLYAPGRGGNLRLGVRAAGQAKWMHEAEQIVARYRPGAMLYEIRDPLWGAGVLQLEAIGTRAVEGLLVRAEWVGTDSEPELLFAYGGVNGMRGRRNGDIGCENEPVSQFFQLRTEQCTSNRIILSRNSFAVQGRAGVFLGVISGDAALDVADAGDWADAEQMFASRNTGVLQPLVRGSVPLIAGSPVFVGLKKSSGSAGADTVMASFQALVDPAAGDPSFPGGSLWDSDGLPALFEQEEELRRMVAERVVVNTPDSFVNAAAAALNVAADAVWDDHQEAYLHGGVAWRVPLLGWRVSYAGDALGWHERTAKHFLRFSREQNTNSIPPAMPLPEKSANLSRNETALHSNGNLTRNHYDMNLVAVDAFFRHLLWTGDLEFAQQMWPVIERHFAWERRLFRREFGDAGLPLYEAYAAIWASDDLAYNGGGTTHASAYNVYHNRMAARVAKLLGKDPTPYEREAELIAKGMKKHLWLSNRGWFAEWKDLLGEQRVHPNPAVWTFYHTVDSEVPTTMEAWQMTRFVETHNARFPLSGLGVPKGTYTIATSSWMPYSWSLNNVVMAETMHTALGYWQAGRPEAAFPLFKGALLDSMYLGLCPGNVGMCTFFDAHRRESQRDFGDGVGATSRTLVEGLFGVQPNLLEGTLTVRPGFPREWNRASIEHPDFALRFDRENSQDSYLVESRFSQPIQLRLQTPAWRDKVRRVQVNGLTANWHLIEESVGQPRIEITAEPAAAYHVVVEWSGEITASASRSQIVQQGELVRLDCGATITELRDPQDALSDETVEGRSLKGVATGTVGQRTVFARVEQGNLRWWQPVSLEIQSSVEESKPMDWRAPRAGNLHALDLSPVFNARVGQIFENSYLSPRSPFCSLAIPQQGIGSWCHPLAAFEVDDSGLRAAAAKLDGRILLPNGIPLATPPGKDSMNIAFVSQWDNYPKEIRVPLEGRSSHAFLLMAGSTSAMQSRFDNGEVIVTYTDASTVRLPLHNPTTWWPIDQDYYIDHFAFARPEPLPVRVDLQTGAIRVLESDSFLGRGGIVPGGAATVLDLQLDQAKELESLTLRALANEVVIGLMSVTLERN